MKAYLLSKVGSAEVLKQSEQPAPPIAPGAVRVNIETIGLNYAEIQSRKGLYGWAPKRPYIPGMEAYGEITELGQDVGDHKLGDKVIVVGQFGFYAEQVVVPDRQVLPAFEHFSAAENAAFAVQFMTAWVALFEICRLRTSDRVLIQAAAGGVGTAAVQIAHAFGCEVFGTTSSNTKLALIERLGGRGINYHEEDFAEHIRRETQGEGVDVVLEVVGGEVYRKSLDLLNPFGRMAVVGFASLSLNKLSPLSWWKTWKAIPRANINDMAARSQVVGASHLGYLLKDRPRMMRIWGELADYAVAHGLRPIVGHEFKFSEMFEAHTLMESRQSQGKIVLHVGA